MTTESFLHDIGNVKVETQITDKAPSPTGGLNITVDLIDAWQRDLLITELDRLRASIIEAVQSGERFYRITFTPYPTEHFDGAKLDMQFRAGSHEILVAIDASSIKNRKAGARCVEYIKQRLMHAGFPFDAVIADASG